MVVTFKYLIEKLHRTDLIKKNELILDQRVSKLIIDWPEKSLLQKCISLIQEIGIYESYFAKWQLVRLFGKFPSYQPKKFLSKFQKRYSTRIG
jgi:hypothetical protein